MTTQPLNDIICAEGDGLAQVATHLRWLHSRLSNIPVVPHDEAVVLRGRIVAVKGLVDRLDILTIRSLEEHLAERTVRVLKAERGVENVTNMFLRVIDEVCTDQLPADAQETLKKIAVILEEQL